jgi:uncharacterized membrane protein
MVVVVGGKRFFVKMKSDRDKKASGSGHNTEFSGLMGLGPIPILGPI